MQRTYSCEMLDGTTRLRIAKVSARFPAEAAEHFIEELSESGSLAPCDGDSLDVMVTVDDKIKVKCNVIVSVRTTIVRSFVGMEAS